MTTATSTPAALAPLFEPITLGNVEIRNRVVMTGHGTGMAKDYLPTDQHVAYYRERAMGGVGLIGMAFPQIHPTSQDVPGELRLRLEKVIAAALARAVDDQETERPVWDSTTDGSETSGSNGGAGRDMRS